MSKESTVKSISASATFLGGGTNSELEFEGLGRFDAERGGVGVPIRGGGLRCLCWFIEGCRIGGTFWGNGTLGGGGLCNPRGGLGGINRGTGILFILGRGPKSLGPGLEKGILGLNGCL